MTDFGETMGQPAEASHPGPRLIVNADDFGASRAVNRAVARGAREGILTACSLMATGTAFDEAVRIAAETEGLAVGLHLVTVLDRSLLGHAAIPSITARNGDLSGNAALAGLRYFASPRARRELERELRAQFRRATGAGIALSHVDSHLHMHVNPAVFETAVKLAKDHGVRAMRLPLEEPLADSPPHGAGTAIQAFVFKLLCRRMRRRLREEGMISADRIHGFFHTGRMTEDRVVKVLERLPEGTNELYLHPADHGGGVSSDPHERQSVTEFGILLSEKVRAAVVSRGVQLTDYRKLSAEGTETTACA